MKEKEEHRPYIGTEERVAEFTVRALVLGSLLAIVFGLANAYLGLKVGMTVSASIPAAVISMAVLRGLFKKGTVLENNIVQTIGSSGESLAAGVIFTIPAFFLWDVFPSAWTIILISFLGGILGILMMIPLRRYLIVQEHKTLPFPEGTACAEILKAGDTGGSMARTVFLGVGLGALYKALMSGLKLWKESPNWIVSGVKGAQVGMDVTPALLGVGYIIGPRIAAYMTAGAVLGYLVISPLIAFIGSGLSTPIPPAEVPIALLSPSDIRGFYIRYIGAGAVAVGGILSLFRAVPIVYRCFKGGVLEMFSGLRLAPDSSSPRVDKDLPMSFVLLGSLAMALGLLFVPGTGMNLLSALIVVLFSFFFVTVASRIVGLVGSSSSPVSGMTIATLLLTCLAFTLLGWRGLPGMIGAMSVGSVVCMAICMAGDASQDLKTGYLVGATPYYQQIAEFIGVIVPALIMGGVLQHLHRTLVIGSDALPAPQASLMSFVVKGVLTGTLPWSFVLLGVVIGLAVEMVGVSALPFAIGLYLPLSLSTPIMLGALIYAGVKKIAPPEDFKVREEKGILFSSGLVAGDALVGILIAFLIGVPVLNKFYGGLREAFWLGPFADLGSLGLFLLLALCLWQSTRLGRTGKPPASLTASPGGDRISISVPGGPIH